MAASKGLGTMNTFRANRRFKRKYRALFRKDPRAANFFLLMCELADENGQVRVKEEAELASLFARRFPDSRRWHDFVSIQKKTGTKVVDLNRRRAIPERCLNCGEWSIAEVRNCQHDDCDLHPFCMGTGKQNPKERRQSIFRYCSWYMVGNRLEVAVRFS